MEKRGIRTGGEGGNRRGRGDIEDRKERTRGRGIRNRKDTK